MSFSLSSAQSGTVSSHFVPSVILDEGIVDREQDAVDAHLHHEQSSAGLEKKPLVVT